MELNFDTHLLLKHLCQYYKVQDNRFFLHPEDVQRTGYDLIANLAKVFYMKLEDCEAVVKNWAFGCGLEESEWNAAYQRRLQVSWSPELAMDLRGYNAIDMEAELIYYLSEEIAKELDREALKSVMRKATSANEFLGVVRCIGFGISKTYMDMNSFAPKKYFETLDLYEINYERQNNIIWQNHFRSREQD